MNPEDRKVMEMARDALKSAQEGLADWGSYASEYFQDKWDLQGDIDALNPALAAIEERLQADEKEEPVARTHPDGRVTIPLYAHGRKGNA